MNWLFTTTRFPWPIVDGHWLRVYHLARTLRAQGDGVAVLSFEGNHEGKEAYDAVDVEVLPGPRGTHSSRGCARCLLGPYAFDERMAAAIALQAPRFDAVVLSGCRMLQYAPEASLGRRVIADLIDDPVLEYGRRREPVRGLRQRLGKLVRRLGRPRCERQFLRYVDVSTFVSKADCESFQGRHPSATIACVANGVDIEHFGRPTDLGNGSSRTAKVVFTGYMSNPNNELAAVFLVREVAPQVWRRRPDVRFQIVGADPTPAVLALAGERVEVTGRVSDLRPYLWEANVVALPMQSGTGIKNKLLEAWAAAAPVVATPLACQGVPAREGDNLLLSSTREEFASCTVKLLGDDDLRRRVAIQGRLVVERQFTWSVAAERLQKVAAAV